MSETTYEISATRWRRSKTITISSLNDTRLAVFPLPFVQSCGDNTWQYVLNVVEQLVERQPQLSGMIFTDKDEPVNLEEPPFGGVFRYKLLGKLHNNPSLSPETKSPMLTKFCRSRHRADLVARSRVFQPLQGADSHR